MGSRGDHGRRCTHIWTDASIIKRRSAGAYVINRSEPQACFITADTSIRAELQTIAVALGKIRDGRRVVLHTDVRSIYTLINGRRKWPELVALRMHLRRLRLTIHIDAWDHPEYNQCHHAARAKLKESPVAVNAESH